MNSVPLQVLNQTHADFDSERYLRRRLLYIGGEEIQKPENAALFIPKMSAHEIAESYRQKLACAHYTNIFGSIVNYYVAQTFNKKLTVSPRDSNSIPPFYEEFKENADDGNTSFVQLMKEVAAEYLTHGQAFIGADLPVLQKQAASLQEEEDLGATEAYLYRVPQTALIDWDLNSKGLFQWCRLKKVYSKPVSALQKRELQITEFKVWSMENGVAKWQLYRVEHREGQEPVGEVPLVAEGTTSFSQIPILRLTMPEGLCVGNKIAAKCADHYRHQSSLFFAQNRSLYAAPYYVQGGPDKDGGSPLDDNDQRWKDNAVQFVNRGFLTLAKNDSVGFMEPTGSAYSLVNDELKEMVDDIYRICHQMSQSVTTTSNGSARSAASKVEDNHASEIILEELGALASHFAADIYSLISTLRGEEIVWDAKGLSDYKVTDREKLIAEAVTIPMVVAAIPSRTFQKTYLTEVALAVLQNIPQELEQDIITEIDDAVENGALPLLSHPPEGDLGNESDPQATTPRRKQEQN